MRAAKKGVRHDQARLGSLPLESADIKPIAVCAYFRTYELEQSVGYTSCWLDPAKALIELTLVD